MKKPTPKLSNEDAEKLKRIYLKYRHFLYRNAAFPILNDHALSEDAVHETIEKISRCLYKIDESEEGRTKGFLLETCRNAARDIYNKRTRLNKNADLADEIDVVQDPAVDIQMAYVNKEMREEIVRKVKTMHPGYRLTFFLRYARDWSYDEIAEYMEIEPPAARKRIERIRRKLVGCFRKEDDA